MSRPENDTSPDARPHAKFCQVLLENPARSKILEMLDRRPGMNKRQISVKLDFHFNSVEFHLNRMVEAGLVKTRSPSKGRETFCFTADNVHLWDDERTRILYGRSPPRQVALYLTKNPGAEAKEIAEHLGLTMDTVRRHIKSLEEVGLIQRLRVQQSVFYHAESRLQDWVDQAVDESEMCSLGRREGGE